MHEMRREARKPKYIPGVYNYCDRWCERCPFTARCLNYRIVKEDDERDPASRDIRNKAFWDRLGRIFAETRKMISKHAREQGIDLDAIDIEELARDECRRDRQVRSHPCAALARRYAAGVAKWMIAGEPLLKEKQESLNAALRMELPGADPADEANAICDALDVVAWYQYFIGAKVHRALHGAEDADEPEDMPRDCDGSAKIALMAVDRSIAAWATLRKAVADEADTILDFMVLLDRLRRGMEKAFPDARAFVRPGFDE
jgi:hypothetical protein